MPHRTYVNPAAWAPNPGYTPAVATAGRRLLFVSGQVALDAEGRLVGRSDFVGQVRQSFENMKTVLAAGGASLNDLVKLTYFVVGLDETRVKTLRTLRNEILPVVGRPASTLLGVSALAEEGMLIEIEGIAELPESNA